MWEVPMENTFLPVILLKKTVLLPYNELRLEFDNETNEKIIHVALNEHNKKILVVSQLDYLEENPSIDDIAKIGVVATIKSKIDLPNGKTRVLLEGINRALVNEYIKDDKFFTANVSLLFDDELEEEVNVVVGRKLKKEIENYIKIVPYISNSVISQVEDSTTLSRMTDIIVNHLQISFDRMIDYISCSDPLKRTKMILEDVYKDEESYEIENHLDSLDYHHHIQILAPHHLVCSYQNPILLQPLLLYLHLHLESFYQVCYLLALFSFLMYLLYAQ